MVPIAAYNVLLPSPLVYEPFFSPEIKSEIFLSYNVLIY